MFWQIHSQMVIFKDFDPDLRLHFSFSEYRGLLLKDVLAAGAELYGELKQLNTCR